MTIRIFVDGSIVGGNPGGVGGWAIVVTKNNAVKHIDSGFIPISTNNVSELFALSCGAYFLLQNGVDEGFELWSDSEYVVNPFEKNWISGWARKHFKRKGEDIPNAEAWENIWSASQLFKEFPVNHMKGHHADGDHKAAYLAGKNPRNPEFFHWLADQYAGSVAQISWNWHQTRGGDPSGVTETPQIVKARRESHRDAEDKGYFPTSLKARWEILKAIKNPPPVKKAPPPPPIPKRQTVYAVYRRTGAAKDFIVEADTMYLPTTPSEHPDGGLAEAKRAAATMNSKDDTDDGRKFKKQGGRHVVLPYQGAHRKVDTLRFERDHVDRMLEETQ